MFTIQQQLDIDKFVRILTSKHKNMKLIIREKKVVHVIC
jgi:hypothetical protein